MDADCCHQRKKEKKKQVKKRIIQFEWNASLFGIRADKHICMFAE